MKKRDKVLSLLGLCARGGNLASGEFSVEKAVKSGRAALVIVGEDASDNTKKMFANMCEYRSIPIYFYASKQELGNAVGKEMRSSAAVLNKGLAQSIIEHLESQK